MSFKLSQEPPVFFIGLNVADTPAGTPDRLKATLCAVPDAYNARNKQ